MNNYFQYSETLLPGGLAKSEEIASEFESVETAFNLLPPPREDGLGFTATFLIPDATEDGQAATWGQLKDLTESAQAAKIAVDALHANLQNVLLPDFNTKYSNFQALYPDISNWHGESEVFRNEAQSWADEAVDVEVEPGSYSARHWAKKAEQLTSGSRVYQGVWDASGGTLPIASPAIEDRGKFWRISVAGTLPVVGAVQIEDELSINASQVYELAPSSTSVQSVNGQVGTVVLDKSHVGLGNVPNYTATSDTDDSSPTKLSTAAGVNSVKTIATSAQSTASTALSDAATAQSTADEKGQNFYQNTEPTGSHGDRWINNDTGEEKIYITDDWVSISSASWMPLVTASQAVLQNKKYMVEAIGGVVEVTLPTFSLNGLLIIHATASSDSLVRILNPSHTIRGAFGSVSPGDDLTLSAGETVHLVYVATNILEVA